jgi:hypothetical protein
MDKMVLLGISELQRRFGGRSRQRIDQLTRRSDFPGPCAALVNGRVWLGADVEAWIRAHRPELSEEGSEH